MKIISKTKLLKKEPLFINNFSDSDDVLSEYHVEGLSKYEFSCPKEKAEALLVTLNKRYRILFADYTYEDYSGDSYVLGFDKEKKQFFEVSGGHCSCYGLEDQWGPTYYESWDILSEVILKTIKARYEYPYYSRSAESSDELIEFLEIK